MIFIHSHLKYMEELRIIASQLNIDEIASDEEKEEGELNYDAPPAPVIEEIHDDDEIVHQRMIYLQKMIYLKMLML